jgi:protein farnesyltransferase subunit beta
MSGTLRCAAVCRLSACADSFVTILHCSGTYCAMVIATMLNIMTPELTEGAAEYIATCQTYEGGIGGEPGAEAHGGYTFCAFAALTLLGRTDIVDNEALLVRQ